MSYRWTRWTSPAAALILSVAALAACEQKTQTTTDAQGRTTETNTVAVDETKVKDTAKEAATQVAAGATAVARGVKEGVQEGKAKADQKLDQHDRANASASNTTTSTTETRR
jgi:hypothetical protein